MEPPKLTPAEALKDLESVIAELGAVWERDGLDWAPALLTMLRDFSREAGVDNPDQPYFKEHRYLKGISNVLWDIDTICRRDE